MLVANSEVLQILLIEHDSGEAEQTRSFLRRLTIPYRVEWTDQLSSGVARLEDGSVDLVLLDLKFPNMRGLAALDIVHSAAPEVPIVVMTRQDASDDGFADPRRDDVGIEALRHGAHDFLSKSDHGSNAVVRSVGFAVERRRRHTAEAENGRNREQFDVARAIQAKLLPSRAPVLAGFDIAGACYPAEATGGDLFDYIPMTGGRLGIVVADVADHGFGPALIMASTRSVLRTLAKSGYALKEVLTLANEAVMEDTLSGHFVTVFFADIDPFARRLIYCGAGHRAYLLEPDGACRELGSTCLPLGVVDHLDVVCADSVALHAGQLLLLLTDGLGEAGNLHGELFGEQRVIECARKLRRLSAAAILAEIFGELHAFCRPGSHQDDVTAVVVKVE